MFLSWNPLAYQWIIPEVFHSDEEFANPSSCITLVCVACMFDRHLFGKQKLAHKMKLSEKIHLI